MAQLTPDQVAELLVGIARSQHAVIAAITEGNFELQQKILRSLQGFAGVGGTGQPPVTLLSLPSRILLQYQGALSAGKHERLQQWTREELEKLLPPTL